MLNGRDIDIVYVHDGTMEGFFTAVFYAYQYKETPRILSKDNDSQQGFGCEYRYIQTEPDKFRRVYSSILRKTGKDTIHSIHAAFLSCYPDKDDVIFAFIKLCLSHGPKANQMLTEPCVMRLLKLSLYTLNEYQKLRGFIRFSEVSGGIFYAKIAPKNDVLALLAPHFADRLKNQMFVIHDTTHNASVVYNKISWVITDVVPKCPPAYTENEEEYRKLWKEFFKTIEIKERKNPKLQRQMAPKRYWENMLEMH